MRPGRIERVVALTVLLAFAAVGSGCYGGFHLTRTLYMWNGKIEVGTDKTANRVAQSVVMVLLYVVPIYELAALADAVIINTIEFWSGKNPVELSAAPVIRTVSEGDDRYVQTFTRTASGREMRVDYYRKGRHEYTLLVRQAEDSPAVTGDLRWSDGRQEAFQVTYAREDTYYTIRHSNAAGAAAPRG